MLGNYGVRAWQFEHDAPCYIDDYMLKRVQYAFFSKRVFWRCLEADIDVSMLRVVLYVYFPNLDYSLGG